MNCVGFFNQYASGASNSLWLFGAGALMTGLIFIASLTHGTGGTNKLDIFCLSMGFLGVALWILFKSPVYSISANLITDITALIPSFSKARKHPKSETRATWLVGAISSLLATISVGRLDWQLLILPGSAVLLQGYMVYILYIEAPGRGDKNL